MATIGSFKMNGGNFEGSIATLELQATGVRIVVEQDRQNDNAPTHRVLVGRAEIGAAWTETSEAGRKYLQVKLDDPSLTAPIYANLCADNDGHGHSLIWSRPKPRPAND